MSGMHWEKRNREKKIGIPQADRFVKPPGWRDKPSPITFRKWPTGHVTHDNCGAVVQAKRKARITLPEISILKSD